MQLEVYGSFLIAPILCLLVCLCMQEKEEEEEKVLFSL